MEEGDLGPLPTLRLELEHFLRCPPLAKAPGIGQSFLPEPSIRNYEKWLEWQAYQLDTPHWWEELTTIPGMKDMKKLAQKICTSFEVPAVRHEACGGQVFMVHLHQSTLTGICFCWMTYPTSDTTS